MNNINNSIIDANEEMQLNKQIVMNYLSKIQNPFAVLSVQQVSKDLHIGINQAYELFRQKDFPAITIGKRKVITLANYLLWKMSKKESEV